MFADLLADAVRRHDVSGRALGVRALLHLPRLARWDGTVGRSQVIAELNRNAGRLQRDQRDISTLIPKDKYLLSDLRFVRLRNAEADQVFSRLHYLRSARPGSLNFALIDPVSSLPVTLCSLSPLEWTRVGRQLETQFEVPQGATWDVSRVYSFDVAPANAISYLLARVRQVIRTEIPGAQLLTTAVDPNLGFTGASYRAANWQQWMSIEARPYLYIDGVYVSPRQLRARFGGANLAELSRAYPDGKFERSRARLLDSMIFCCRLRGETIAVEPAERRRLRR
ncbi:hypothetical protein [Kribbella sp. NBC_00889]|uniref:Mom family adenine methylcarbamoylation protein n=1 Tax=Kribbella sp. NBC_00889 TaxID=2975974 RepID=UPI003865C58D|nr:hypothetical protein OG817_18120 [Kribbella sp. NBC_00889]